MLSIKYSRIIFVLFSPGSLVKRMALLAIKMTLPTSLNTIQTFTEAHISNGS